MLTYAITIIIFFGILLFLIFPMGIFSSIKNLFGGGSNTTTNHSDTLQKNLELPKDLSELQELFDEKNPELKKNTTLMNEYEKLLKKFLDTSDTLNNYKRIITDIKEGNREIGKVEINKKHGNITYSGFMNEFFTRFSYHTTDTGGIVSIDPVKKRIKQGKDPNLLQLLKNNHQRCYNFILEFQKEIIDLYQLHGKENDVKHILRTSFSQFIQGKDFQEALNGFCTAVFGPDRKRTYGSYNLASNGLSSVIHYMFTQPSEHDKTFANRMEGAYSYGGADIDIPLFSMWYSYIQKAIADYAGRNINVVANQKTKAKEDLHTFLNGIKLSSKEQAEKTKIIPLDNLTDIQKQVLIELLGNKYEEKSKIAQELIQLLFYARNREVTTANLESFLLKNRMQVTTDLISSVFNLIALETKDQIEELDDLDNNSPIEPIRPSKNISHKEKLISQIKTQETISNTQKANLFAEICKEKQIAYDFKREKFIKEMDLTMYRDFILSFDDAKRYKFNSAKLSQYKVFKLRNKYQSRIIVENEKLVKIFIKHDEYETRTKNSQ